MSLKAVICQDPPEIWMIGEVNPVHVPDLSLIPVCSFEDVVDRLYGGQFVCVGFNTDS